MIAPSKNYVIHPCRKDTIFCLVPAKGRAVCICVHLWQKNQSAARPLPSVLNPGLVIFPLAQIRKCPIILAYSGKHSIIHPFRRGWYARLYPHQRTARLSGSFPRSLSENPIWLRAACLATGRRPAPSTIYSDIACFTVLARHKTARSRADDGIPRQTPSKCVWNYQAHSCFKAWFNFG